MADIATPSAATMSTIDAGSEPSQKSQNPKLEKPEKPEKPDEKKYKESLAKAQKEHAAAQEKVVRLSNLKVPVPGRGPIGSRHVGCHQGQNRSRPTSKQGLSLR